MKNATMKSYNKKNGEKEFTLVYETNNNEQIMERLAWCLAAKYIGKAPVIKSIKRIQHYTYQEYIVTEQVTENTIGKTVFEINLY